MHGDAGPRSPTHRRTIVFVLVVSDETSLARRALHLIAIVKPRRIGFCLSAIVAIQPGCNPPAGSNLPCAGSQGSAQVGLADGSCGAFGNGTYTLAEAGITYRVILNSLSRPSEVFWGTSHAAFAWSNDSSQVTAIIDEEGASEMHTYIVSNPGNVRTKSASYASTVVSSESVDIKVLLGPAASGADQSGESSVGATGVAERSVTNDAKQIIATFQNAPPFRDIPDYLTYLGMQALANSSLGDMMMMHIQGEGRVPTRSEAFLIETLSRISNIIDRIADHQEDACLPCTALCGLGCYGACRTSAGGLTLCVVRRSTECLPSSTFTLGAGCFDSDTGACCLRRFDEPRGCRPTGLLPCTDEGGRFSPIIPCESANCAPGGACCLGNFQCFAAFDHPDCEAIANREEASSFTFHENMTCDELAEVDLCNQGVCCFPDGSYNCDYRNREACLQSGREGARFAFGPCEAATCGH